MADDNVEVRFGADTSELGGKLDELYNSMKAKFGAMADEMKGMGESSKESADKVKESMEGMNKTFETVSKGLLLVTAALAGGKAFQETIEKTVELTGEANKLSKTLGITVQEGGRLADTLGDIGSSSEQYIGLSQRLGRQLKTNEEGLKSMGIATRDASGNLRNQQDMMLDALSTISKYADGVDKNQAAMAIFGGRVGDLTAILRLNDEKLKETAETQRLLGSEITPQNVAAMLQYKDTMADVHNVMDAVQKVIGDTVLPRLTAMGEWFVSIGPAAVQVTKAAMQVYVEVMNAVGEVVGAVWKIITEAFTGIGQIINAVFGSDGEGITALQLVINMFRVVQVAVISFRVGFEETFNVVTTMLRTTGILIGGWAAALNAALHFDVAGAAASIRDTGEAVKTSLQQGMLDAVNIAQKGRDDIDNAIMGTGAKQPAAPAKTGGTEKFSDPTGGAAGDRMKEFEVALEAKKVAYMKEHDLNEMSKADEKAYWDGIIHIADLSAKYKQQVMQKQQAAEIAMLKEQHKQKSELEKMSIDETQKRDLDLVAQKEVNSKHLLAMGHIDQQQDLQNQIAFENEKFNIMQAAQSKRIEALLGDPTIDPVALQKNLNTMQDMQQQHDDKIVAIQRKAAENTQKVWLDNLKPITDAFDQTVNGMIAGTQTFQKGMDNMWKSILEKYASMLVKMGTDWAARQLADLVVTKTNEGAKTAAVTMGTAMRTTASTTAATTEMATSAATSTVQVTNAAVTTGANVGAKQAESDGWYAIAEGLAAMGIMMALVGNIKSSAGGEWQVPSDRLNFVHKNETILPANIAGPLRNMVEGGGGMGGTSITIHAVDAQSVQRLFMQNGSALMDSLRSQNRQFNGSL
jgi:hypothetical protein